MKIVNLLLNFVFSISLISQTNSISYENRNRIVLTQPNDCSYTKYSYDANGNRTSIKRGAFSINPIVDSVKCYKAETGKIDLKPDSGKNYSYQWSNGKTSPTIENLASGSYSVTITDANAVQCAKSFTLREPDSLTLKLTTQDNICYQGKTGLARLDTSIYTNAMQYKWSDSSAGFELKNLAKGNYAVTISNVNNCKKTASFEIKEAKKIITGTEKTEPLCYGWNTGSIKLLVLNTGYTYAWSDGVTTQNRYNLAKGNYSVTISESTTGCIDTASEVISEPTEVKSVAENIEESCKGAKTGKFTVATTGGSPPYSYALDGGSFNSNSSFENLSVGNHTLITKDAKSCEATIPVTIGEKNCNSHISNPSENSLFILYPNPNQGIFNLEFSETLSGQVEIQITTLDGKLVKNFGLVNVKSNKTHSFTTESLVTGVYILTIKKDGRMLDSIKLKKN